MREMTKAQIEERLQQIGIDPTREQTRTEMLHLGTLVRNREITIEEALATVPDEALRKKWRPFIHATFLISMVTVWEEEEGRLSQKQAQEIREWLLEIGSQDE